MFLNPTVLNYQVFLIHVKVPISTVYKYDCHLIRFYSFKSILEGWTLGVVVMVLLGMAITYITVLGCSLSLLPSSCSCTPWEATDDS